jgi:hypothetical protein
MWPLPQPGLAVGVVDFSADFSFLLTGLVVLLSVTVGMIAAVALRDVLTPRRRSLATSSPAEEDLAA